MKMYDTECMSSNLYSSIIRCIAYISCTAKKHSELEERNVNLFNSYERALELSKILVQPRYQTNQSGPMSRSVPSSRDSMPPLSCLNFNQKQHN